MRVRIKRYFIAGILIVLPLYVTFYLFSLIVGFMDSILYMLPEPFRPQTYLPWRIPGIGALVAVFTVFLVGFVATNFLGRQFVEFGEGLLDRIPFLRAIYKSTKNFLETFFSDKAEGFKKVVLVEFPKSGVWSVGFVTGKTKGEIGDKTGGAVGVFVPTTPNPTTGFYIAVKETDLVPVEMTVEDAFKLIMTVGVVFPDKG